MKCSRAGLLVPLSVAVTLLEGCGSEALTDGPEVMRTMRTDTLPNGAIVILNPEEGVWTQENAWRLIEELRIGAPDGPAEQTFGRIGDIEVDDLGRIWITDLQAREIRIFDDAGRHVRTVGRQGAGPGEFSRPVAIHRHPDGEMWVIDPGLQRYSVIDTSGVLLATHQRHVSTAVPQRSEGFRSDGMLMELEGVFDDGVVSTRLLLIGEGGVPQDTIRVPTFEEQEFEVVSRIGGGTARYASRVPFTPSLVWRADARGHIWHGITSPYRVVEQAPGGDTLRMIERSFTTVTVSSEERDSALASLDGLRQMGAGIDATRIPSNKPAFDFFLLDDVGYLWVQPVVHDILSTDGARLHTFDVFDPDGVYLGRLSSPAVLTTNPAPPGRIMPVVRGNRFYGVTVDELGVQYVVRLRIEGR